MKTDPKTDPKHVVFPETDPKHVVLGTFSLIIIGLLLLLPNVAFRWCPIILLGIIIFGYAAHRAYLNTLQLVVCAAITRYTDKKEILLVTKRGAGGDSIIFPGGKPEKDANGESETDLACLEREISEELPHFETSHLTWSYWDRLVGKSPNKGNKILVRVYYAKPRQDECIDTINGIPDETPPDIATSAGDSIVNAQWADYEQTLKMPLSAVTRQIIQRLKKEGQL